MLVKTRKNYEEQLVTGGLSKVKIRRAMTSRHSSLMRDLGIDPKVVADLMGHDVNVNLNVYTQTPIETRLQAVGVLESALVN